MKVLARLLAFALLTVAALTAAMFIEVNSAETQLNGLGLHFLILPLGAWLIIFLLIGVLLGWVLSLPAVARLSWRAQRNERALKKHVDESTRQ